jgi:hypothetical protein
LLKKVYKAFQTLSEIRLLLSVMNYPIPVSSQEIAAFQQKTVDEGLIAAAILGVIAIARSQGQSLDELKAEVLADDALLDMQQRRHLSEIVAHAWDQLP